MAGKGQTDAGFGSLFGNTMPSPLGFLNGAFDGVGLFEEAAAVADGIAQPAVPEICQQEPASVSIEDADFILGSGDVDRVIAMAQAFRSDTLG